MNKIKKTLSNFKPIELESDEKFDETIYQELSNLLKRIGRSEQKSAQISTLLKDEISEKLTQYEELINKVKERSIKQEKYFKMLENAILEYYDIIDNMAESVAKIGDESYSNSIRVAQNAINQINEKIGIQKIPGAGAEIDLAVHYVVNSEITQNEKLTNTVKEVLEEGYRIGDRIIRHATVVGYKYGGKNE